ncbi:hypothetical protein [Azospirillum sp. B4]|uniref:hypothetical protein n=1 Tax=Azospirillum sp. B4 TaxID=95605 RepID=UPI0011DD658D|nr:hypothetical protein [Azospirillum sp. B4]
MSEINAFKRFYDEFRDAELNKEYYANRLSTTKKKLKMLNIFLAIFAGTSAVLSFSFWSTTLLGVPIGSLSLAALTGIAVVLSIMKPYLGIENEIERISSIQGVYSVLSSLHKDVIQKIMEEMAISDSAEICFDVMRKMRISVDPKEDRPADKKLVQNAQDTINKRYPQEYFWYPLSATEQKK